MSIALESFDEGFLEALFEPWSITPRAMVFSGKTITDNCQMDAII
jgi:hypothetical protein